MVGVVGTAGPSNADVASKRRASCQYSDAGALADGKPVARGIKGPRAFGGERIERKKTSHDKTGNTVEPEQHGLFKNAVFKQFFCGFNGNGP